MSERRQVYFHEFNVLMDRAAYLPLVAGSLQAYALQDPQIAEAYQFMPFQFFRDRPDAILARHDRPAVAAFSVSMWSEQLSLHIAAQLKERFPQCLIVFGGAQVPHDAHAYRARHPFIDVTVRGEGEQPFTDVLVRFLSSRDFTGIPGVSFVHPQTGAWVMNDGHATQLKDLDHYPSPYLEGIFEPLFTEYPDFQFQAIIETNRGCPFPCTFCYWGWGGLNRKYRYFSMERVAAVVDWCARHKIRYVFNADSNFGMLPRDGEIARVLVEAKQRTGYPEKFRTCFGKNSDDKIFEIATLLHKHELEKGITLARQSNDDTTLINIRRENIQLSTYRNLQQRFDRQGIPVYVELILGLPGETVQSWMKGLNEVLAQTGIKNQLFVYFCQVYPNTELDGADHRKKFKIETVTIPLTEIHGGIRPADLPAEREEIIVATYSMTRADWRRMALVSWMIQVLHGLKLAYFPLVYLVEHYQVLFTDFIEFLIDLPADGSHPVIDGTVESFRQQLDAILNGGARGRVLPEFGNIYWDEEEAALLTVAPRVSAFHDELEALAVRFLEGRGIAFSREELHDVFAYQRFRTPALEPLRGERLELAHDVHGYFQRVVGTPGARVVAEPAVLVRTAPRVFDGDKRRFAREVMLFGRKSAAMLHAVEPVTPPAS